MGEGGIVRRAPVWLIDSGEFEVACGRRFVSGQVRIPV